MDYSILIPKLINTVRNAGKAILTFYNQDQDPGIEIKPDNSPITLADKAANKIICESLKKLPFQFPIISEENKLLPFEIRKQWETCWLVDPLDGTKEFIKKNGEFTVNIALIQAGKPVLGVVYVPCIDELFWAVQQKGAFLIESGQQRRLYSSRFKLSDSNLTIISSRSHFTGETEKFIAQFDQPVLISKGSSLKILLLAKGEAQIYPRIAPTMEWDTAAAQIILEEAGGKIIEFGKDNTLNYNKSDLKNPAFVAYGQIRQ